MNLISGQLIWYQRFVLNRVTHTRLHFVPQLALNTSGRYLTWTWCSCLVWSRTTF